jgi:hypothetical protein
LLEKGLTYKLTQQIWETLTIIVVDRKKNYQKKTQLSCFFTANANLQAKKQKIIFLERK